VKTVVAVSCNPNTFARDAEQLVKAGYRMQKLYPVGQFLWSTHVEFVARFVR
jgi:23S rRNA (uracil1939-C5)-methyltransferase